MYPVCSVRDYFLSLDLRVPRVLAVRYFCSFSIINLHFVTLLCVLLPGRRPYRPEAVPLCETILIFGSSRSSRLSDSIPPDLRPFYIHIPEKPPETATKTTLLLLLLSHFFLYWASMEKHHSWEIEGTLCS